MAPRPNWKGYLKLSLVSCPVALYPASSSGERVYFRQINKQTGNRLRQRHCHINEMYCALLEGRRYSHRGIPMT